MKNSNRRILIVDTNEDSKDVRKQTKLRRLKKNWTKFWQDHQYEYDDLDEFYTE